MPFQFRMRPELRRALEQAAAKSGRSINAEMATRLERSFQEEFALGGTEMRWLVHMVVAAFTVASRWCVPDEPHSLRDKDTYLAGMFGAIDAMMIGIPDATPEDIAVQIEGLKGRLLSRLAQEQMEKRK
jgi:hypothetical protein